MFTGIVEYVARVQECGDGRLILTVPLGWKIQKGSSIAVNGVCLTVVEMNEQCELSFDVVDETMQRTNLGLLSSGDSVNIERAMRADGRFEGHIVQGHVDVKKSNHELRITNYAPWRRKDF